MKAKPGLFLSLTLAAAALAACGTATTTPTQARPSATASATAAPQVEPTGTPVPDSETVELGELPIGEPGYYVNLAFGFQMEYPATWFTGFGNRPLLASFSNLDPGTHNRHTMRLQGCLIEVSVTANIFRLTPHQVVSQLARSMPGAEPLELSGEPAMNVRPAGQGLFESEVIVAAHEDRLFSITLEHATEAAETCSAAWGNLLSSWQWFEPDLVVYRNARYGYAISYPRLWYLSDAREEGVSISSLDPSGVSESGLLREGMLAHTNVHENPQDASLTEWLTDQNWDVDLTHEVPLDGLVGVRILRDGPSADVQQMSGYYFGPLGRIYEVTCLYPKASQEAFEPIASAILYGFSF